MTTHVRSFITIMSDQVNDNPCKIIYYNNE